jgi:SAM-dependent methyltransferase
MWFDGQADQFDDCSGLAPDVGERIARAVLDLGGAAGGDTVLDLGAGTGAVGRHFAALPVHYVGLDQSGRMLAVFRRKLEPWPHNLLLLRADGDRPWPVRDHSLAVVFASRVAHHLRPDHFVREVWRCCRPGGAVILGRVTREPDSLPSRLQRSKREVLTGLGVQTRTGGQAVRQVVDLCRTRGATELGPVAVARWRRAATPRQLLAAWEAKPQLSSCAPGAAMSADVRAAAVAALGERARREVGDLDRPQEFTEEYTLCGARLPREGDG